MRVKIGKRKQSDPFGRGETFSGFEKGRAQKLKLHFSFPNLMTKTVRKSAIPETLILDHVFKFN